MFYIDINVKLLVKRERHVIMKMKKKTDKQKILIIIGWLVSVLFVTYYLVFYDHLYWKRLLALECIFLIALILHIRQKEDDYLKRMIGLTNTPRRYQYDHLRILAICFVIITHAIQTDLSLGAVSDETQVYVFTVIYWICLVCNLLYVMLSGALLMPYREEKLSAFYLRRISKIVIPMGIYYIFYLWQNLELGDINREVILNILERLYQGDTPESPHYWLMYVILSLYIVMPFFRFMFKNMPYSTLTYLVLVCMLFMSISLFGPIAFGVSTFLSTWIGVAIMGYWVTQPETRKYDRWLMILGIAGIAIGMIIIWQGGNFRTLCCNCSPIMCMVALGIFSFIFSGKIFAKGNIILNILSKYSYSIILLHWWGWHYISRGFFHISSVSIGGIVLSLVVTLVASFIVAFIIDNLIIIVFTSLFDFIVYKLLRFKERP